MVTINMSGEYNVTGTNNVVIYGLSTDTKPVGGVITNGSAFIEMDTSKTYLYDQENGQWLEWGNGGSGGVAVVGTAVVGTAVVG